MMMLTAAYIVLVVSAGDPPPAGEGEEIRFTVRGVVRGPDRHPVANATVWLPSYYGAVKPERSSKPDGRALTDAEGRYTLKVSAPPSHLAAVLDRGVSAQADGFVRVSVPYRPEPMPKAGERLTLDIVAA